MEVHLSPEQEHRLSQLASRQGRDADALAQEAISRYLEQEARFIEAVKLGEDALDHGEYLTHEALGKRLHRLFKSCWKSTIRQAQPTVMPFNGSTTIFNFSHHWCEYFDSPQLHT